MKHILQAGGVCMLLLLAVPVSAQERVSDEELRIATTVAVMLQSARAIISAHQERINDPAVGDKGLTGDVVLDEAIARFRETTGVDPLEVDPSSYEGRLLRALMDAVVEVMDDNQETINADGVGFKGFIPATFARLVTESFGRRVDAEAAVKVTAPPELVRNRQSRPDDWEEAAIREYLQDVAWPRGKIYAGFDDSADGARVRVMVPEYYGQSCLSCHGGPAGEIDVTGYPKEGASEGDLGGVISIRLVSQ